MSGSTEIRRRGLRLSGTLALLFALLQHFQVASIGGFPLTVGAIAGVMLLVTAIRRPSAGLVPVVAVVLAYASLTAIVESDEVEDGLQYWRTLALVLCAITIIAMGLGQSKDPARLSETLATSMFAALVVIVALSALQVIFGAMGNVVFFNPFGGNQYLYQYDPLIAFNPIPRAQGFYLEPSYLAFMVGSLAVILFMLRYRVYWVTILALAGMGCARSATGLLLTLLIATILLLRNSRRIAVSVPALLLLALPAAIATWPYLDDRIGSVNVVGSSAYYRLLGPLEVLTDVLTVAPMGYPMGSVERILPQYQLLNGAAVGGSLDNGFYLIVFYFGWFGVVGVLAIIGWAFVAVLRSGRRSLAWMGPVWVVGSLGFSGGIFLPEFAVTTALVILVSKLEVSCRTTAINP